MMTRTEYMREYTLRNKARLKERMKKYYEEHKGERAMWHKAHRVTHDITNRRYIRSPKGKYKEYQRSAKIRHLSFNITFEQFMTLWQKPCYYSRNHKIETIGLDRIDSSKGYSIENVVPCCEACNKAKLDRSVEAEIVRCNEVAKEHPRDV